jgi:N-acetylneuraminate synthase
MEPQALRKLITSIREVEIALGDGIKAPLGIENQNKKVARKSLVAAATIKKGEPLTEDNMAVKRPGTGVSPFEYWSMLSMQAHKDYAEGDLLEKE